MPKFDALPTLRPRADAITHQGGSGFKRTPKMELLLLGVSNAVGENGGYEKTERRDARFVQLVKDVTATDPVWVRGFVRWLRTEANMRSAAIVAACQYVAAGGEYGRGVIDSACSRPDEPGEVLAYWRATFGRKTPMPVKRGVADAVRRLYNEKAVLRYDGQNKSYRFGDVVELVHPSPSDDIQSDLFRHLIDRRHGRDDVPVSLQDLVTDRWLMSIPEAERRSVLPEAIAAGWSWERVAGWIPGGLDAQAWEAVIPNMGAMALVRNLRNFDEAGISDEAVAAVKAKLTDPNEIRRSRQFPLRFLNAWKNVTSLRWAETLETALQISMSNVPSLPGRTLVLLDVSGSMSYPALSDRALNVERKTSPVKRWEAGGVFALAVAQRAESAELHLFNTGVVAKLSVGKPDSILRTMDSIERFVDGGTATLSSLVSSYDKSFDRVVIVSDEQTNDRHPTWGYYGRADHRIQERAMAIRVPIFTFNIGGYAHGHLPNAENWITFGGLSDASFGMLEYGRTESPWLLPR